MSEKRTYFISRAGADKRWAELIASVVRDAAHEAVHEDQDFSEGTSISHNIMLAAQSDCTIAVLSPAYFESEYCLAELHAALNSDPLGVHGRILPVLVAPCELPRFLGQLAYVNLLTSDDDIARKRLLVALSKHGKQDASKLALRSQTRRVIEQADRNRSAMIEKVRTIWITGFLQQSLFNETRILFGMSELPDAVARPMDLLVKRPNQGERPLSSGVQVVDVFDAMDRALLVLGAPGSGKTTLLLELARDLLTRAADDPSHPIPVIFPLSTWAETRKPLVEWLQNEFKLRYDVPRAIAENWIVSDQVLPLLDGLDEVNAEHRAGCLQAINAFRQQHGFLPLIVTSRTAEYELLAESLRVQGAVLLRPLTRDQVSTYLEDLGPVADLVRIALKEDESLWDLLDSPLMLNIITMAYAGQPEAPVLRKGSVEDRRDYIFATYVDQMFQRRTVNRERTRQQTLAWLSWLAQQMAEHNQSVFYLERLQVSWLPERQRPMNRIYTKIIVGIACGLIIGILCAIGIGLVGGTIIGLVGGLSIGLVGGIVFGRWLSFQHIISGHVLRWSWIDFRHSASLNWSFAMVMTIIGLFNTFIFGQREGMFVRLACWVLGGLVPMLTTALVSGMNIKRIEISVSPNEGMRRSARNGLISGLLFGLISTLSLPLLIFLFVGGRTAIAVGSAIGLVFGVVSGVSMGLIGGGAAFLAHCVLRWRLVRNGSMPWNYVRFLDYAADRNLLRKVGGGYVFLHRMLLEYFAARYVDPSAGGEQSSKSPSIEMEV